MNGLDDTTNNNTSEASVNEEVALTILHAARVKLPEQTGVALPTTETSDLERCLGLYVIRIARAGRKRSSSK